MNATPNWIRYFRLYVGTQKNGTEALDFSSYRVKFTISQAVLTQPCTATVRIYNVGPETAGKITAIGQPLIIEAGYESNHGQVFVGKVVWKSMGRETPTETFMELMATAGGFGHSFAVVSASIPSGADDAEVLEYVKKAYAEHDVKSIKTPELRKGGLPRGRVYFDSARNVFQELADNNALQWGYADEGIVAMPIKGISKEDKNPIVLSPATGLESRPMITLSGLQVKARLNPNLNIGARILVDPKEIQTDSYNTSIVASVVDNTAVNGSMEDPNGLYKVLSRVHSGDTHGDEWTTTLVCEGVNASMGIIFDPARFQLTGNGT